MIPFEKYEFQRVKNVFKDEDESVAKFIEPALANGMVLQAIDIPEGSRTSLHKKGRDFYLQVEGSDQNEISNFPDIVEDFKIYKSDFIVEGILSENGLFTFFDTLYLDGDLENEILAKRHALMAEEFRDHMGYSSKMPFSYLIDSKDAANEFLKKRTNGNFVIGSVESLYTAGCHSNQWCTLGEIDTVSKSSDPEAKDYFVEKFKKQISGEFTVSHEDGIYKVYLQPVRPLKHLYSSCIEFESIDKSTDLKRKFEKGDQFSVGFSKHRSPNPNTGIDFGRFTILKSADHSTVIDFDGYKNVFKGIFHVDGAENRKISFSDANIDVDKRFGNIVFEKEINKSSIPILKNEEEEQFILGEVLVPEDVDAHGDIYDHDEVRFAAHFYMEKFGNVGLMHEEFINDHAKIVESYVAPVDMDLKATDGSIRKIKKGTWLMGMSIINDVLWKDIKAGLFTGFSIGGIATVQELKKLKREYEG